MAPGKGSRGPMRGTGPSAEQRHDKEVTRAYVRCMTEALPDKESSKTVAKAYTELQQLHKRKLTRLSCLLLVCVTIEPEPAFCLQMLSPRLAHMRCVAVQLQIAWTCELH